MINQRDILARLQAGESPDAIAQEMVDVLNAANAEYAQAQEKEKIDADKKQIVTEIAELVKKYILTYYPDSTMAEAVTEEDFDADTIVNVLDAAFAELDTTMRALKHFENIFGKIENKPVTGKIVPKSDAIGDFLKANGLV